MTSKLTQIRSAKGISQKKLEQLSGVHQQTISRIENGYPLNNLTILKKLAKALDCDPSDILDIDLEYHDILGRNIKNINNYIKTTRELLELTPRRAANVLNMEEKEYLDCENPNNPMPLDQALIVCSILYSEYSRMKLSTILQTKSQPVDISENEEKALRELRRLSPEDQEKFINLIVATPLLK